MLVETITAYVSCDFNARETALHLNYHVNTIYYRMSRIAKHTGYDTRRAEDLIDLLLAIHLIGAEAAGIKSPRSAAAGIEDTGNRRRSAEA